MDEYFLTFKLTVVTFFLNLINSVLTLSFLLYVLHFRFILSAVKRY